MKHVFFTLVLFIKWLSKEEKSVNIMIQNWENTYFLVKIKLEKFKIWNVL
jgi:hypothetical protein